MASSYTYTCYLIDVSPSMGQPLGADLDPVHGASKSRLSYALDSVRIRIAQRIMNPKATDQIAIVTFGDDKTANMLADREGYDNIVEISQMHQPSFADLNRLNDIEVGTANVDLISALYVAGEIVRQAKVARKDAKKQIILFTDAEEPMGKNDDGDDAVSTAWKETSWMEPLYTALVPGMDGAGIDPKMHFTLTIVGSDFGDPEMDLERRKKWSKAKQWNVDGLMALFQRANQLGAQHRAKMPRVSTAPVQGYIALARQPSVPVVATTSKLLPLHIGDPDKFPDESLTMQISLQKAAQKAASKSLGKMRRGAWTKTLSNKKVNASDSKGKKRARDYSEDEDEEDEDDEDRSTLHQPGELAQDKKWYYVPQYKRSGEQDTGASSTNGTPRKNGAENSDEDDSDEEDAADKAKRDEASRRLETTENLSKAYRYGTDLIPLDEPPMLTVGEAGLSVRGFMPAAEFHLEWALNDPYWVFPQDNSHQMLAFSALLWAMRAKDRYAVIRLVPPSNVQLGQKQPRIGILIPCVGEDAIEGLEMGLLLPMPFKEELANWSFPSLDRILTVTGVPVTEHRLLPKPDLLDAMDKFADSMMLPSTSEEGQASGSRAAGDKPWFDPTQSYNPAIHNFMNKLIDKVVNSQDQQSTGDQEEEVVDVHPMLTRYMYPPEEVMSASADAAAVLQKVANLTLIPPKPKLAKGKGAKSKAARKIQSSALHDLLGDDADEFEANPSHVAEGKGTGDASQADARPSNYSQSQHTAGNLYRNPNASMSYGQSQSQSQSQATHKQTSTQGKNGTSKSASPARKPVDQKKSTVKNVEDDDSATEGSDTEHSDIDADGDKTMLSSVTSANHKPSLISDDKPIEDFERLVEQGGHMTSTAVKQFLEAIPRFVDESAGEYDKPLRCVRAARKAALEEDEAKAYNNFLRILKSKLTAPKAKHADFFDELKYDKLGLVTVDEGVREANEPALEGAVHASEAKAFWTK